MATTEEFLKRFESASKSSGTTVADFLKHHGVKGMKWGVRKDRGSRSPKKSGPAKAKAHELSDEELKKAVARMEMEKKYHDLLNPKQKKANNEAANFAKGLGKDLVRNAVSAVGTHVVQQALKK
jgi:hypothetical protein